MLVFLGCYHFVNWVTFIITVGIHLEQGNFSYMIEAVPFIRNNPSENTIINILPPYPLHQHGLPTILPGQPPKVSLNTTVFKGRKDLEDGMEGFACENLKFVSNLQTSQVSFAC